MLKQKLAAIDFYAALEQHPSPNVKATFDLHIGLYALNEALGRPIHVSRLSWFY
jgi:hypothetical protein